MNTTANKLYSTLFLASTLVVTGCSDSDDKKSDASNANSTTTPELSDVSKSFTVAIGTDINSKLSPLLSLNPGGPGGSSNQSLRGGDVIVGANDRDDILIGGLGVDVLVGYSGDDIIIGGTEDFNSSVDGDAKGSDNRDRAFGNEGNDVFIWAPGDGSDFFDGGEGTDVLIFGKLGEQRNSDGKTEGAPFFNVNPPKPDIAQDGSQDFDGIFLDENNQPIVDVSTSPGFCSIVDATTNADALDLLNIDQIVRFSLRGFANAFDAGDLKDDGLRVAVSIKDVEYVVCTTRNLLENGGTDNIEVLDLTTEPPTVAQLSDLPEYVAKMIK
jgi:hypothetical protein